MTDNDASPGAAKRSGADQIGGVAMTDLQILIRLHKDRRQVGSLSLVEFDQEKGAREVLLQCDARGKADSARASKARNQHRDPRQPMGDTPTGRWAACKVVSRPHMRENDGIGPRWIELPWECAGDDDTRRLLDPRIKGSRSGLGIHGGRGNGDLVATQGCVRVRDEDFRRLDELIGGRSFDVVITDEPVS